MVSRLFGKLEAQRQRMFGRAGACATAWVTAAALTTAPPAMNLRRSMRAPGKTGMGVQPRHSQPRARQRQATPVQSAWYFAEFPCLVVRDRLLDLLAGVHHEGPIGDHRFAEGLGMAEQEQRAG